MIKSNNLIPCGVINQGMGDSTIYFNKLDGSFVFRDSGDNEWYYVSEVTAKSVNRVDNIEKLKQAVVEGTYGKEPLGVILQSDCVTVILDDSKAENRPYYPSDKSIGAEYNISLMDGCEDISIDDEIL